MVLSLLVLLLGDMCLPQKVFKRYPNLFIGGYMDILEWCKHKQETAKNGEEAYNYFQMYNLWKDKLNQPSK